MLKAKVGHIALRQIISVVAPFMEPALPALSSAEGSKVDGSEAEGLICSG